MNKELEWKKKYIVFLNTEKHSVWKYKIIFF